MRNVNQGVFIQYVMSRKGVSTSRLARRTKTSPAAISQTVWGTAKSQRLENAVARHLGFRTWKNLKQAEGAFNKAANKTLGKVSEQLDKAM